MGAFLGGESIIINEDKTEVRRYLLGQLGEAEEERLELRLLTDASFIEEFDDVVDEMTDQYAGGEFEGEEKKLVEKHFLGSAERQQKVQFAQELLQRAAGERAGESDFVITRPGFFERIRRFFGGQSIALRTATAIATVVIVVAVGFQIQSIFLPPTGPDALITLNLNTSDRASGTESKTIKLEPETQSLRVELILPDQSPQEQNYRVELLDEQGRSRDLQIQQRTPKSLIAVIQAGELPTGSYNIHLHAINPDGTERRIRGGYSFNRQ